MTIYINDRGYIHEKSRFYFCIFAMGVIIEYTSPIAYSQINHDKPSGYVNS